MARHLDDQFNRSGTLLGSTASPTGGTWATHNSSFTPSDPSLNGSSVVLSFVTGYLFRNSATPAGADRTVVVEFTPTDDSWAVGAMTRATSDGQAYEVLLFGGAPSAGYIERRTSTSNGWGGTNIGTVTNTGAIPVATNRTSHTLEFSVIGSTLTAKVDGVALNFGSTLTDSNITGVGFDGFMGKGVNISYITGDDVAAGSTAQGTTVTATASIFGGTATGGVTSGTFTSEVLKRNNGTVAASVSLTYVRFYNISTGALVLTKTGLSTNGSGVFTTTDAALVSGTTYAIDWEEAGGQRRMPRKAAT